MRAIAGLTVVLAGAAACSGDDAGDGASASSITVAATTSAADQSDPTMPDWIQRVRPEPDAADSAERAVSVDAVNLPDGRELRLRIDGIDVTAQALVSEPTDTAGADGQPTTNGRLRYDPRDTPTAPLVELTPGGHSATAELRERSGFGTPTRLVDSYTWHFVVQ